MAIAINFNPPSMTIEQYNECIRRLEIAEAGSPHGRSFHACFGTGDQLRVFDIWDSRESFEQFSETLIPILAQLGIDPGEPQIVEVHNVLKGS